MHRRCLARALRAAALGAVAVAAVACGSSGADARHRSTTTARAAEGATTSTVTTRAAAPFDPASVAAVPSTGCGTPAAAAVTAGETTHPITAAGVDGSYFRHVPPAYDGTTPLPLVVDLHGYSENAQIEVAMSQLGSYGDTHGFVTVTPETTTDVPRWNTSVGSADQKFVAGVLDAEEAALCVDTARVYMAGLSNGAQMTSAIACSLADRVAAVAPVAGLTDYTWCKPDRPVPVIAFHGTADPFISYDGGYGAAVAALPAPGGNGQTLGDVAGNDVLGKGPPPEPDQFAAWAARNGCGKTLTTTAVAADVDLLTYACPRGDDAELYRVNGGGHAWPGSEFSRAVEQIVGPTTFSINADDLIWAFFQSHPLH